MIVLAKHTEINSALPTTHLEVFNICKAVQQIKRSPQKQKEKLQVLPSSTSKKIGFSGEKNTVSAMFHYLHIF